MKKFSMLGLFFCLYSHIIWAQIYNPYDLVISKSSFYNGSYYKYCDTVYYKGIKSFIIKNTQIMKINNLITRAREKKSFLYRNYSNTTYTDIKSSDFSFGSGPNGENLEEVMNKRWLLEAKQSQRNSNKTRKSKKKIWRKKKKKRTKRKRTKKRSMY